MSQDSQISFHSCILDISGLQHGCLQPPCSYRNIPDAILASSLSQNFKSLRCHHSLMSLHRHRFDSHQYPNLTDSCPGRYLQYLQYLRYHRRYPLQYPRNLLPEPASRWQAERKPSSLPHPGCRQPARRYHGFSACSPRCSWRC